ncbi:MAG: ribonuclease HII [Waddliaceae bacterium]|nr:ribonuclease HII [Waddliaceae bacterium]
MKAQAPQKNLTEIQRLKSLWTFESAAAANGFRVIAGVDEAGRGPLAGPVLAAACILPESIYLPGLDDSKKLSPAARERLFHQITNDPSISVGVGIADHHLIDDINIYQATIQAMLRAVDALSPQADYLLVDGLQLPHPLIKGEKIIKGDSKSLSIAAASIIAKVTRDRMMLEYDAQWPEYGFAKHKGYGTAAHRKAIEELGPCPIHRMSFEPLKSMQLSTTS